MSQSDFCFDSDSSESDADSPFKKITKVKKTKRAGKVQIVAKAKKPAKAKAIKAKKPAKAKAIKAKKSTKAQVYYKTQLEAENAPGDLLFKYGMKLFSKARNLDHFLNIVKKEKVPQYFEICNKNTKLMADLENYTCSHYELIVNFTKFLSDVFKALGYKFDKNKCIFIVDNSGKKSSHFMYNDEFCFANNGENSSDCSKNSQWEFWQYAKKMLFNTMNKNGTYAYQGLIVWTQKKRSNGHEYAIQESAIDFGVYSKKRAMRLMYNQKNSTNERVFIPVKINHDEKKVEFIEDVKLTSDYMINNYADKPKHYNFDINLTYKHQTESFDIVEISKIILDKVDNVKIFGVKNNLVKLLNTGDRECLISGYADKSDGSYVVVRKDGLYYYCHDKCCNENPLQMTKYPLMPDGSLQIHKFDERSKKIIKKFKMEQKEQELVYADISRLVKTLTIESATSERFLDDESVEILTTWAKETIIYIQGDSRDSCYVKSRLYNYITKTTCIEWVKRNSKDIFSNADWLGLNPNRYPSPMKICTIGKFVELMVRRQIITRYDKITFIPFLKEKPTLKHTFNLFSGYEIEKTITDESKIDIDTFVNSENYRHIKENICNNDQVLFEYHLNWLSHLIQKPSEKPGVCLVFYSKGGGGKDLHLQFIGNIIGGNMFKSYKSVEHLTGNFNVNNKNKLLIALNEVDDKASMKNHNALKHIITMEEERIEPKGIDPDFFPCFKRIVLNTNYRDCMRIELDCRRYVMYEMNNNQIGDFKFFKKIADESRDIDILQSAFKFFSQKDISEFNIRNIPVTKYKKEQAMLNVKSTYQFLQALQSPDSSTDKYLCDAYKFATDKNKDENDDDENIGYPVSLKYNYDFKRKDLYDVYKQYCEDYSLNICKPKTIHQDMISLGLYEHHTDAKKNIIATRFVSPAYREERIRGYRIINSELQAKLEKELNMKTE